MIEADYEVEAPHLKPHMLTRVGRLVDALSYTALVSIFIIVVALASAYFYNASQPSAAPYVTPATVASDAATASAAPQFPAHGITGTTDAIKQDPAISVADAVYFSIITLTSTGYGDYAPSGGSRAVAGLLVLFGVAWISVLIGKVASERQFSIALLLYNSDCQRRLTGFCEDLAAAAQQVRLVHQTAAQDEEHKAALNQLNQLLSAIRRYVFFHANQGMLLTLGNETSLLALYKNFYAAQEICAAVFQSANTGLDDRKKCYAFVARTERYVQILVAKRRRTGKNGSLWNRLLSLKSWQACRRYLMLDGARETHYEALLRLLEEMRNLREEMECYAQQRALSYRAPRSSMHERFRSIVQYLPDQRRFHAELAYWSSNENAPTGERRNDAAVFYRESAGQLVSAFDKLSNLVGNAEPRRPGVYAQRQTRFEAYLLQPVSAEARFALVVSDPTMVMIEWLMKAKAAQIIMAAAVLKGGGEEQFLAALERWNDSIASACRALHGDLARDPLRRCLVRLIDRKRKRNRSATRDVVLHAILRETAYNHARIARAIADQRRA